MSESELHMALRQLPREAQPTRDLWPDIAARIAGGNPARTATRHRWHPWAIAATVALLALGMVRWWPQAVADPQARMVQQQVAAMAREYDAAQAQLPPTPLPPALAPDMQTLDASAAQIRQALRQAPQSTWLIAQLQHTYALRLQLRQRAVQG